MDGDPEDLTQEQFALHRLYQNNGKYKYNLPNADSKVNMTSPLIADGSISTYYATRPERLEATYSDVEVLYQIDQARHTLMRISVLQDWPALKVKKEVRDIQICWCHNRGTAIFDGLVMKINTKEGPSLQRPSTDAAKGFYNDKNIKTENELMGNNNYEENWSRQLPVSQTNPSLPFSFSRGQPSGFFPNYYLRKDDKVRFVLTPRRKLTKLLRMRKVIKNENGDEQYEYFNEPDLTVLEGRPNGDLISQCSMYGYFMDVLDSEKQGQLKCSQTAVWPFEDFITLSSENEWTYGRTCPFAIKTQKVIKAFFVMAENLDATDSNCLSNYTTDPYNLYDGWDVISEVSYYRGGKKIILPLSVIKNMQKEHFPSIPKSRGILAIPLCLSPRHPDETVGIALGAGPNSLIEVKLHDCSPFGDQNRNCRFRVHCVLQVLKQAIFTKEPGKTDFEFSVN